MSTQNRYIVANVSTTNANVGILGGNTVAMIGGSLCNKAGNTAAINLWVDPLSGSNCYFLYNFPVPANSSIAVFGNDQKHFLINGDVLWISSNIANGVDFILSTAEGV
jgi:hypothetical protein